MAANKLDSTIGSLDARINRVAERFSDSSEHISKVSLEDDVRIVKTFPLFLAVCIILWIVLFLIKDVITFTSAIQCLCLAFMICFMMVGAYRFVRMSNGVFPKWLMALMAIGLVISLYLFDLATDSIRFHDAIRIMGSVIGIELDRPMTDVMAFISLTCVFLFTTVGVLSALVACLRVYLVRVFLNMEKHCRKRTRRKAEGFFDVPTIVDPQEVILEPEINYRRFDTEAAADLAHYMIVMMLLISSYVFLNPFFLDTMSVNDMISIMFMLSMFVPALIIPWQIIKDLHARVTSEAHRDYYLWTGAKKKLMNTFITLGAFSMMFLLSIYYGHNPVDIFTYYLLFLVPLFLTALAYAMIYTNNFQNDLKVAVLSRFLNGKEEIDNGSE